VLEGEEVLFGQAPSGRLHLFLKALPPRPHQLAPKDGKCADHYPHKEANAVERPVLELPFCTTPLPSSPVASQYLFTQDLPNGFRPCYFPAAVPPLIASQDVCN